MRYIQQIFFFFKELKIWEKSNHTKGRRKKTPLYTVIYVNDLPNELQPFKLYLLGKPKQEWLAGLVCPCGCGDVIELVLDGNHPRWSLFISPQGHPSLSPSVYRSVRCRSHFFLKKGLIKWCSPV